VKYHRTWVNKVIIIIIIKTIHTHWIYKLLAVRTVCLKKFKPTLIFRPLWGCKDCFVPARLNKQSLCSFIFRKDNWNTRSQKKTHVAIMNLVNAIEIVSAAVIIWYVLILALVLGNVALRTHHFLPHKIITDKG
jgi:hypothetical protein